ncbi:hypothetical protein [Streptomyces fagopyri]|uniref:hypothetical protein n=1 Tax=Streptomyces fagopyri TaxID=2662397 RepID=UPI0033CEC57A
MPVGGPTSSSSSSRTRPSRLQNGVWVNGVDNCAEYVRSTADHTLTDDDIHKTQTPVLLLEGEDDGVFAGQAAKVASELRAPHEPVVMRSGAGAYCHEGAMFPLRQTVFNFPARNLGWAARSKGQAVCPPAAPCPRPRQELVRTTSCRVARVIAT